MLKFLKRKPELVTISNTYPAHLMEAIIKLLKIEDGYKIEESGKNVNNHCIRVYKDGNEILFGWIASNQKYYLLKSTKGFLNSLLLKYFKIV